MRWSRFNQQFAETRAERNVRLRASRQRRLGALEPTAPGPEPVSPNPSAEAEGRANNTYPTTQEEQP